MTTATVLGGGMSGVLAATVLAEHVDEVVVIERDRYPTTPAPRRGLPQGHHSHMFVTGGVRALEALLPGTLDLLLAGGAHKRGLPGDTLVLTADGWCRGHRTDAYLVSCSRALMDHVVRRQALGRGDVAVWQDTRVLGLTGDADRVTGVAVSREGAAPEVIRADIVVDATGRSSRAVRWLAALGVPDIDEVVIPSGLAYSTRLYRAPSALAEIPAILLHPRPGGEASGRGATLLPIEDGRWMVTLTGMRGGEPPADERGFAGYARSLRSGIVAELMAEATPVDRVRPYRNTTNRRTFFERVRLPGGFLAIGDSVLAVNPIHSHGMSIAALSALRLATELAGSGADPSAFPRMQAAMADEAERSWRMATEQDAPRPSAPADQRRPATPFERGLQTRLAKAVLNSPELASELFRAQALIPGGLPRDASSMFRALSSTPEPFTEDEAITQFAGLASWWASRRGSPSREPRPSGEHHVQ